MTDDIPRISDAQHTAFREFIRRHRDEAEEQISANPILLALVVARDKPAAYIDLKAEKSHPDYDDPDAYLFELCSIFDLHAKKIKGHRGWTVGPSSWRLDLLPTTVSETDAYHRRRGVVYGYPPEAIASFIETETNVTYCDLVRAGYFTAEEIAYTTFVPYTHHNSLERYTELIETGKAIRRRITRIADTWDIALLDDYADALYADTVAAYRGEGYRVMTTFPPDQNVTPNDVEPLLQVE